MSRTPKPVDHLKGNLTKDEKEKRKEKEAEINSRLKRDDLKPPAWLDATAKKTFLYLIEQLEETDLVTNIDVNALATYCDLHSRRLKLMKDIKKNGMTLKNENSRGGVTYISNPSLTALNTTIKLLQSYESRFGFTVYDRTKIALKDDPPPKKDKFGELFD